MTSLLQKMEEARPSDEPDFYVNRMLRPVFANMNPAFSPRTYQKEAFGRFDYYWIQQKDGKPVQLLFHMATGSGKTLIMAGLMVYLYEKGYRNFLFFVNNTNIIQKTKDNFLNAGSVKYLFHDPVVIGERRIRIREVENFHAAGPNDINIVFTTIQGLHSRLNIPKENCLTYEDFETLKIVFISDEAHHINAETKKGIKTNRENSGGPVSWENTVNRIVHAHPENVLLEFTATADLLHPEIAEKYDDKIIFDYPLKQFRKDGFSKEVKVLEADLPPVDRALQAVLLSQYRKKIFERNQLRLKPVILFKSKTIRESRIIYQEFIRKIQKIRNSDLERIKKKASFSKTYSDTDHPVRCFFEFCRKNSISLEKIIAEIKSDFCEERCISVNSREESEQKQIAVNTLEDERNPYRAIFAVDKLNEGWDVLNLFDIVRLYDTKGASGKTAMSEAQLIGRGARYCPFQLDPEQAPDRRKYDGDLEHELRICEVLYYHSSCNPHYIRELDTALKEIGIRSQNLVERRVRLKGTFTHSAFYKSGVMLLNEPVRRDRKDLYGLPAEMLSRPLRISRLWPKTKDTPSEDQGEGEIFEFRKLGRQVIRKAIFKSSFYEFSNLKRFLPNLKSISEFITSSVYAGGVQIEWPSLPERLEHLNPKEKLEAASLILEHLTHDIASDLKACKGSEKFKAYPVKQLITEKKIKISLPEETGEAAAKSSDSNFTDIDIQTGNWYVWDSFLGTREEARSLRHMEDICQGLKSEFEDIYLIQNYRNVKLFNIEDGSPVHPEFIWFLHQKKLSVPRCHQIFITLKSPQWMSGEFLTKLSDTTVRNAEEGDRVFAVWALNGSHRLFSEKGVGNFFQTLLK